MNKKRLLLIMTMAVMPAGLTRAGVDSPYNGTSGYTPPQGKRRTMADDGFALPLTRLSPIYLRQSS